MGNAIILFSGKLFLIVSVSFVILLLDSARSWRLMEVEDIWLESFLKIISPSSRMASVLEGEGWCQCWLEGCKSELGS